MNASSRAFWFASVLSLGCGARVAPATVAVRPVAIAHTPADAPPTEPAPPEDPIERRLCGARAGCSVASRKETGDGALELVSLKLAPEEAACTPYEWWLVEAGHPFRKLIVDCNDGYGARGVGEDEITVEKGILSHSRTGGSAWGWGRTWDVALPSGVPVAYREDLFWSLGPNTGSRQWDLAGFVGDEHWAVPLCDSNGEPPDVAEPAVEEHAYPLIPRVELPAPFRDGGWKTLAPQRCGLSHGELTVVADDQDAVYIQLTDARITRGDVLTLHLRAQAPGVFTHCFLPEDRAGVVRFEHRLAGAPRLDQTASVGTTRRPTFEQVPFADGVRIRVTGLPELSGLGFTVSFRDDDGGGRVHTVATSALRRNDAATLGRVDTVPGMHCELGPDGLSPAPTLPASPERPMLE